MLLLLKRHLLLLLEHCLLVLLECLLLLLLRRLLLRRLLLRRLLLLLLLLVPELLLLRIELPLLVLGGAHGDGEQVLVKVLALHTEVRVREVLVHDPQDGDIAVEREGGQAEAVEVEARELHTPEYK